jgi:DNA-binding transcriptional ArsR family regulator
MRDTLSTYGRIKDLGRYLSPEAKAFYEEGLVSLIRDGNTRIAELRVIRFRHGHELTMRLS